LCLVADSPTQGLLPYPSHDRRGEENGRRRTEDGKLDARGGPPGGPQSEGHRPSRHWQGRADNPRAGLIAEQDALKAEIAPYPNGGQASKSKS